MKIKASSADAFIKDLPAHIRGVLFFGPDESVSQERQAKLAQQRNMPLEDLLADDFNTNPEALLQLVRTAPLFGNRSLPRLRQTTERSASKLTKILPDLAPGDFFLVEAGDLAPKSKLRQLFENEDTLVAIGCYARALPDIKRMVQQDFQQDGFTLESPALDYLASYLHQASHMIKSELEKIKTYAGTQRHLTLSIIQACCPEELPSTFDQVTDAVLERNILRLSQVLEAQLELNNPIMFYRHLLRQLFRLQELLDLRDQGIPLDQAMAQLRPPVFWAEQDKMRARCQSWTRSRIGHALRLLLEGEIAVKQAQVDPETLCRDTLYGLVGVG